MHGKDFILEGILHIIIHTHLKRVSILSLASDKCTMPHRDLTVGPHEEFYAFHVKILCKIDTLKCKMNNSPLVRRWDWEYFFTDKMARAKFI